MKPSVSAVCRVASGDLKRMMTRPGPAGDMVTLGCSSIVLDALSQHWDNAAATRLDEISALSGLVARAEMIVPAPMRETCRQALSLYAEGQDFRLSALDARVDGLRAALIEVHGWSEDQDGSEARQFLRDIWTELEAIAQRNLVPDIGWF